MKKSVWLFVVLIAFVGAFDALQPFMSGKKDLSHSTGFVELAEFWGFAAIVIVGGVAIFLLRRRSGK
jgi:hypothetical protein